MISKFQNYSFNRVLALAATKLLKSNSPSQNLAFLDPLCSDPFVGKNLKIVVGFYTFFNQIAVSPLKTPNVYASLKSVENFLTVADVHFNGTSLTIHRLFSPDPEFRSYRLTLSLLNSIILEKESKKNSKAVYRGLWRSALSDWGISFRDASEILGRGNLKVDPTNISKFLSGNDGSLSLEVLGLGLEIFADFARNIGDVINCFD